MNYQNKEKKSQMKTIYITLSLSLVVMAVLVVLSGAWRRSEDTGTGMTTTDVMATADDRQVMAQKTETQTSADTEAMVSGTESYEDSNETSDTSASEAPTIEEIALPEFISPVSGYIMKGHSDEIPVFSITMNDYRPHIGVDLYASKGDDVFASANGIITDIWEDPMSGNCISITHGGNAVSIYRNLDPTIPESISVGAEVSSGQVIGTIGESSLLEIADEPHLHFELMIDNKAVDPAKYISFELSDTEYEY